MKKAPAAANGEGAGAPAETGGVRRGDQRIGFMAPM